MPQEQEAPAMKCHVCGSHMESVSSIVPFKVSEVSIVILKDLPILQCKNCGEYLLDDTIMARVEEILSNVDGAAELEVIRFAA